MAQALPEDVWEFFARNFDSVELVHVLALLHEDPARTWTVGEISGELRSSESSVAKRLAALVERGIIAAESIRENRVRYVPPHADVAELVGRAVTFFRQRPYQVGEIIFSKRNDAIRSIADAFRFRKEDS